MSGGALLENITEHTKNVQGKLFKTVFKDIFH